MRQIILAICLTLVLLTSSVGIVFAEPDAPPPLFLPVVNQYVKEVVISVIFWYSNLTLDAHNMLVVGYTPRNCNEVYSTVKINNEPFVQDGKVLGQGTILIDFKARELETCPEDWKPFFEEVIIIDNYYERSGYWIWVNQYCVIPQIGCDYDRPVDEETQLNSMFDANPGVIIEYGD